MNTTLKLNETAKIAKIENPYDECSYLYFKLWQKADKSRVYINDYKRRTLGYIDTVSGEIVINDRQGNYQSEIDYAINGFKTNYVA